MKRRGWGDALVRVLGLILVIWATGMQGAIYYGPNYYHSDGNDMPGPGVLAGGRLELSDNGSTVSARFYKGAGTLGNNIVFFIDSKAGGFADTSQFSDASGPLQRSISGWDGGTRRSTAYFASGFTADYAIALGIDQGTCSLYRLVSGGNGSLEAVAPVNFSPNNDNNSGSYTFNFRWSDIGQGTGTGKGFRFETSLIYQNGDRYLESLENIDLTGNHGFRPVYFGSYDLYGVEPVPEPANLALGIFAGMVIGAGALREWRRHGWRFAPCLRRLGTGDGRTERF